MKTEEKRERSARARRPGQDKGQEGQAMLEFTICIIFLLLVTVALFEFSMVFYSYMSLLNAAREGAVFASIWPDVVDGSGSEHWDEYVERVSTEVEAAGLVTTAPTLDIVTPTRTNPPCNDDVCSVTCLLNYEVMNETQGLFLPLMGRLGLFQTLIITTRVEMPIRQGSEQ